MFTVNGKFVSISKALSCVIPLESQMFVYGFRQQKGDIFCPSLLCQTRTKIIHK